MAGLRCLTFAGVYQRCFRRRPASSLAALAFELFHHDPCEASGWLSNSDLRDKLRNFVRNSFLKFKFSFGALTECFSQVTLPKNQVR